MISLLLSWGILFHYPKAKIAMYSDKEQTAKMTCSLMLKSQDSLFNGPLQGFTDIGAVSSITNQGLCDADF